MRRSVPSVVRALVGLLLLLCASGCTALADEFVWMDKAAPGARPVGDAGGIGTESRP